MRAILCASCSSSAMGKKTDVEMALERAARLAERQALLNAAETSIVRAHPGFSDDPHELLPWSKEPQLGSCTQL